MVAKFFNRKINQEEDNNNAATPSASSTASSSSSSSSSNSFLSSYPLILWGSESGHIGVSDVYVVLIC